MTPEIIEAARAHAAREYPRESCGVIVGGNDGYVYLACTNAANGTEHFRISGQEYAEIADLYEIEAIVHSHPNESPEPSQADIAACEDSGLPWLIIGYNPGCGGDPVTSETHWLEPKGDRIPLIGRTFAHGVLDCYSIGRDYYRWEMGILLPNYPREDDWWDKGQNLYLDNFAKYGFVEIEDLQVGDVILMHILAPREVPNHLAIYLGDNVMLHHLPKRISGRDVYGGYYQRHTTHKLRHESKL